MTEIITYYILPGMVEEVKYNPIETLRTSVPPKIPGL